jgi:parallel beta-helix repeat protein
MKRLTMMLATGLALVAISTGIVAARIINIPADYSTIQAGIDSSSNSDTVLVQPGTYHERINFNGHNIILSSLFFNTGDTNYISATTIDGSNNGIVVTFASGENNTCKISGFTIRNGHGYNGGGIVCLNSNPQVFHNIITNNTIVSGKGAGIYCFRSSPLIIENNITGNTASDSGSYGGGIGCVQSSPTIRENFISANVCRWSGAGIFFTGQSSPTIQNNIINNNSATYGDGGGIYCRDYCNPIIMGNTIIGNLGGNRDAGGTQGGGINCYSNCDVSIYDNLIKTNIANFAGGGISCYDCEGEIHNNTIDSNTVYWRGGGIYLHWSNLTVQENGISHNNGNGIYCTNSVPTIIENVISYNTSNSSYPDGGGICSESSSNSTIKYNLIIGNSAQRYGGGIDASTNRSKIIYNIIRNNFASEAGGGIFANTDPIIISNNVIVKNQSGLGGGIACNNSSPSIFNNVVGADSVTVCGNGMFCVNNSYPLLVNDIIWEDTASDEVLFCFGDNSGADVFYCDLSNVWPGEGNINVAPLFRNIQNNNFYLMSLACGDSINSPCVDAGDPNIFDSPLDCSWGLGTSRSDMGAYGGGDSAEVGIGNPHNEIPKKFELSQNFPNPFNPSTSIGYSLPKSEQVNLSIYNLLGQKIVTLSDGIQQPGEHTIIWDAKDYPSGIYFARLEGGDQSKCIKMVLLK